MRHMQVLRELAELGMDLARSVRNQAIDQAAGGPEQDEADRPAWARGADLGLMFSRIARAVRQTVALEARLHADSQARHDKIASVRAIEARVRGLRRKTRVIGIVERVLEPEADAERLLADMDERLEDEDDSDFADRPIGELVARICRDLGVTPDWSLWDDEAWAIEARGDPAAPADAPRPPATWPARPAPDDPPSDEVRGEVGWNSA